jgi:hypothetical protein
MTRRGACSLDIGYIAPPVIRNAGIVTLRNHMSAHPVEETVPGDEPQTIEQLTETLLKMASIVFRGFRSRLP